MVTMLVYMSHQHPSWKVTEVENEIDDDDDVDLRQHLDMVIDYVIGNLMVMVDLSIIQHHETHRHN